MQHDVWITVQGEQKYREAEWDKTELTAPGVLEDVTGGWMLSYQEAEQSGLGDTHTTILIEPQRVLLRRRGTVNTEMIFEVGKVYTTLYEMPFGALTLDVSTDSIRQKLSRRGGVLEICYNIASHGQVQSENRLKIRIRQKA